MPFDPQLEDYERMSLRFVRSLGDLDAAAAAREFASFGRRFAHDRDSLPQTDADRAFHLVVEATRLIDYQLPFALDEEAETCISHAQRMLDEALSLDPQCHDALRMLEAGRSPSFESYYNFLQEGASEVKARCVEARDAACDTAAPERVFLERDIAMRPYLRWIATLASKALICGRNRETIRLVDELLALDPYDRADARLTAYLAYAKLEDEEGLDRFAKAHFDLNHPRLDAWELLARLALAHKRCDFGQARTLLGQIVELYPNALVTLARQRELPDGVYARLSTHPYSEDELIVAISEATVLLQEGRDSLWRGSLGSWVLRECLSMSTPEQTSELADVIASLPPHAASLLWGDDAS